MKADDTLRRADVLALDEHPTSPKVTLLIHGGREVWAPLIHAAVRPTPGEVVWVIHDHADKPHARVVLPPAEVLPELQAQGLLRDVDLAGFEALTRAAFARGPDEPAPTGLDGPDILATLREHYGREGDDETEDGEPLICAESLERAVADRVLVFCDSHETPALVEDAVAALADALFLDVKLPEEPDFEDVFEALGAALRHRSEHAFLLPLGINDTAILVRESLAPSRLVLFERAERAG
ncbi:MAG: hypothetical protein KF729_34860 [Sandaracinaceae bacterium]|nr:hypothetical protein [Sandaracinaceae bacterium]